MYKVSESFDITILKGIVINQITFGLNFISLLFNRGFIQINGSFSISYSGKQYSYDEVYPVKNDFGLLQILENKVISILINDNRDEMEIEFENGLKLCLIGNEMYESFIISIDENVVRV